MYILKCLVKAIGTNFGMVHPCRTYLPKSKIIANLAISQGPIKLETWFLAKKMQ